MKTRFYALFLTALMAGSFLSSCEQNSLEEDTSKNDLVSLLGIAGFNTGLNVTVEQDAAQADPVNILPVTFAVTFSEAIDPATFDAADITQNGTATGVTWNLSTSDNITWTLEASGSGDGTLIPSIAAGAVQDLLGNNNNASTSMDHSVDYDSSAPTVTINQAAAQVDPVNTLPIVFTIVFSEAIDPATFTVADIDDSASTATGITWNLTTTNNITWLLRATAVIGGGSIIPSIAATIVQDPAGNGNIASTSTDNDVTYDTQVPVVTAFSGPVSTTLNNVSVSINATDNITVTGWMITETSTAPLATDSGWLGTQPSSYTFSGSPGLYTLYLWVKDGAGNVSVVNANSFFSVTYLAASPAPVLQTGQTNCYDELGVIVSCTNSGEDGEYQRGVPWTPATRYTVSGLTIIDNVTGLVWVANASLSGAVTWDNAFAYVNNLNSTVYGGRSDWRMPNILELTSLTNYGQSNLITWMISVGFNVSTSPYWSSTTYLNRSYANMYYFSLDQKDIMLKTAASGYVWAVAGTATQVPKTSQTACWDSAGTSISCTGTGQDGEYQYGVTWPSPRFSDHGDGTVTDNLTGLMWTEDANLMTTGYPLYDGEGTAGDGMVTWVTALNFIDQLNADLYSGYSDWRLPNANEMMSINNPGGTSGWLTASGFTNGFVQNHWVSTTYENSPSLSFRVNAPYGSQSGMDKDTSYLYVWPVRGGI